MVPCPGDGRGRDFPRGGLAPRPVFDNSGLRDVAGPGEEGHRALSPRRSPPGREHGGATRRFTERFEPPALASC